MNSGLRYRYLLEDNNYDALTTDELSKIDTLLKGDDLYSTDEEHQPGVYYVGKDIPAGLYWVDGDETELTYYFKLNPRKMAQLKPPILFLMEIATTAITL